MSGFDLFRDRDGAELPEPAARAAPRAAIGLESTGRAAPPDSGRHAERRAVLSPDAAPRSPDMPAPAELPARYAELQRRNAQLVRQTAEKDQKIDSLQWQLDRSEARHRAWSQEMTTRNAAQDKLMGAVIDRLHEIEDRLASHETADDPGGPRRRTGGDDTSRQEVGQREHGRAKPSNEFYGISSAVGVAAGTVAMDPTSPLSYLIAGAGIIGAGVPWLRKLGKDSKW